MRVSTISLVKNMLHQSYKIEDVQDMRALYNNFGIVKLKPADDIKNFLSTISTLADEVTINIADNSRLSINVDKSFETVQVMSHIFDTTTGISEPCIIEKKMLTRVENFVSSHNEWIALCAKLSEIVGLVCDTSVPNCLASSVKWPLYKEKLNLKPAGGSGYAPHVDTPSLRVVGLAQEFVTVMIAIDSMTPNNGCLRVCPGQWTEANAAPMLSSAEHIITSTLGHGESTDNPVQNIQLLNPDGNGRQGALSSVASEALTWENIECEAGDVYLFSGWLPHRSGGNASQGPRRAVYLTFNSPEDGEDLRDLYYMLMRKMRSDYEKSNTPRASDKIELR